jgi:hypothetical protein
MRINKENFPLTTKAFRLIEIDNGGHLIGTVYPGEKHDLYEFEVPKEYANLIGSVEAGLARLTEEELENFTQGEHTEVEEISRRSYNLSIAHHVLNRFFNGWED